VCSTNFGQILVGRRRGKLSKCRYLGAYSPHPLCNRQVGSLEHELQIPVLRAGSAVKTTFGQERNYVTIEAGSQNCRPEPKWQELLFEEQTLPDEVCIDARRRNYIIPCARGTTP
jgi:hypothetical protein